MWLSVSCMEEEVVRLRRRCARQEKELALLRRKLAGSEVELLRRRVREPDPPPASHSKTVLVPKTMFQKRRDHNYCVSEMP